MSTGLKLDFQVEFKHGPKGRRQAQARPPAAPNEPPPEPTAPAGSVPRVARLMALAIRIEEMVRAGEIADYAEAARLSHVTRARVTQVMNLLNLAPDIQEEILHLPLTITGHDTIGERDLRPIAAVADWRKQRRMWFELSATPNP